MILTNGPLWANTRSRRIKSRGRRCELCGKTKGKLIGHHIIPREILLQHCHYALIDLFFSNPVLCRIRCVRCEGKMHRSGEKWGNTPEDQEIAERELTLRLSDIAQLNGAKPSTKH